MTCSADHLIPPAQTVKTRASIEIYLLLVRYGDDFWTPSQSDRDRSVVEGYARNLTHDVTAFQITRVSGLPVNNSDLEV